MKTRTSTAMKVVLGVVVTVALLPFVDGMPAFQNALAYHQILERHALVPKPKWDGTTPLARVTWFPFGDARQAQEWIVCSDGHVWSGRILFNYAVQGGSGPQISSSDIREWRSALRSLPASTDSQSFSSDRVVVSMYGGKGTDTRFYSHESLPAALLMVIRKSLPASPGMAQI